MQITRSADHGVRVMTHLATLAPGVRANTAEIATTTGAPVAFLGKILQQLVSARLIVSHRGYDGGFALAKPADNITLLDVVTALDGGLCLNQCLPGGSGCERKPWCAVHPVWAAAQAALAGVLSAASIETLARASLRNRAKLDAADRSHA